MPSASSKSSQPVQPAPTQNLLQEPIKNAVLVADKKLRNLEKRRLKILETKKKADQGAELNEDQKKALESLCSVDNSLEAVKDVKKNLATLETEYNKLQKKEQRKKKQEQREYDEGRNLQTLINTVEIQAILGELSEEVRPDFLAGANNACELSEKDFGNLDTIYEMINPAAAEGKDVKLSARVKTASEHLMCIVDAKTKPAFDEVTYKDINEILTKIKNSGYFDKDASKGEEEPVETAEDVPEPVPEEPVPEEEEEEVETPEEEYPPSNFQEEPEVVQPVPVNGVDLPPEVQEQETPENEKIDFLGESEISSAATEVPSLNPVSPEFVPRNLQGGQGENGRQDENWQQVESGQNQHHGNGGFRGRGGRGNRGFGRGGRGGRGNYRGGPRDGNFRGNRGGGRGGRGGNRDGDNYRANRDDNYRGNRDGGNYRGNRDGSRGGNRGRGNRGGAGGAPSNGGFGQPN